MKRLVVCAAMIAAVVLLVLHASAVDAPAPAIQRAVIPTAKQFVTRLVLTGVKDGKETIIAQPTLTASDGTDASFLAGGEAPVGDGTTDSVPFGVQARVRVREMAADQLRVWVYLSQSEFDARGDGNFLIRDAGIHCVKTVKPGEKITADLAGGGKLVVTVNPAAAKK